MKALLWKDMRVNGVLIAYALSVSIGVYAVMIGVNRIFEWQTGFPWQDWSKLLGLAATLSLVLELVTADLMGACAFASERADRTAEFMAYMPVSRGQIIRSKTLLILAVFAFVCALNISVLWCVDGRSSAEMAESMWKPIGVLAALSLCMFGGAWFVSSMSKSHGLSAAVGIFVPIGCAGVMLSWTKLMGWSENWLDRWIPITYAILGTAGYVGGVWYYLRRVEP